MFISSATFIMFCLINFNSANAQITEDQDCVDEIGGGGGGLYKEGPSCYPRSGFECNSMGTGDSCSDKYNCEN